VSVTPLASPSELTMPVTPLKTPPRKPWRCVIAVMAAVRAATVFSLIATSFSASCWLSSAILSISSSATAVWPAACARRVARTLADLAERVGPGVDEVRAAEREGAGDVAEALSEVGDAPGQRDLFVSRPNRLDLGLGVAQPLPTASMACWSRSATCAKSASASSVCPHGRPRAPRSRRRWPATSRCRRRSLASCSATAARAGPQRSSRDGSSARLEVHRAEAPRSLCPGVRRAPGWRLDRVEPRLEVVGDRRPDRRQPVAEVLRQTLKRGALGGVQTLPAQPPIDAVELALDGRCSFELA
jgi:hypothetical protein